MTTTTQRGLGHRWRLLVKKAKRVYPAVCHICGREIDMTLPATHPRSWTLDHLDPRAVHGTAIPSIERVRPACRACNSRRGKNVETQAIRRRRRWAL